MGYGFFLSFSSFPKLFQTSYSTRLNIVFPKLRQLQYWIELGASTMLSIHSPHASLSGQLATAGRWSEGTKAGFIICLMQDFSAEFTVKPVLRAISVFVECENLNYSSSFRGFCDIKRCLILCGVIFSFNCLGVLGMVHVEGKTSQGSNSCFSLDFKQMCHWLWCAFMVIALLEINPGLSSDSLWLMCSLCMSQLWITRTNKYLYAI